MTTVPGESLLELVAVMDRLRRDCPWDREQTHRSLARYLLEETYETLEAIDSGDLTHLREELGDLLLQVYFHARIAEEGEAGFSIDDVAGDIVEKLVRRHPHVFADVGRRRRRRGRPQLGVDQGLREGPRIGARGHPARDARTRPGGQDRDQGTDRWHHSHGHGWDR